MIFTIGSRVRVRARRNKVGTILRHHDTLPAWVVQFPGNTFPVNVYESELRSA